MLRRREIRYRKPLLTGKMRQHYIRKAQDETSGFWTYEGYLVQDDFGDKVDRRKSTYDQDFERRRRS